MSKPEKHEPYVEEFYASDIARIVADPEIRKKMPWCDGKIADPSSPNSRVEYDDERRKLVVGLLGDSATRRVPWDVVTVAFGQIRKELARGQT